MIRKVTAIFAILLLFVIGLQAADSCSKVIKKAGELEKAGKLQEAISLLETALKKQPDHVEMSATLGFYTGKMAGKTKDFMEAGQLVSRAFTLLDRAVELAENEPLPRFYRGILAVNTPAFLGKLDTGISDLEQFIQLSAKPALNISPGMQVTALMTLGKGFEKKNQLNEALTCLRRARGLIKTKEAQQQTDLKIRALEKKVAARTAPDKSPQPHRKSASKNSIKPEPDSRTPEKKIAAARKYMQEKKLDKARKILDSVLENDPENLSILRLQLDIITQMAATGYDENVHTDTAYRTKLAFAAVNLTEKISRLAPHDMDMLLRKGATAVAMPFFVNKLEQGMADLKKVLNSDNSTDDQKAQALYFLGLAHRKKMTTYWIRVAKKYGKTSAARSVFATLNQSSRHLLQKEPVRPCIKIDFILGFRDELAPQTAVWIEDQEGEFIKTVYVSGFCGHAREKQEDLPIWSDSSEYRDVDGVTRASIDQGHHVYYWDLKNFQGKKVAPGKYRIWVETHFWPSMMYQRANVCVTVGSAENSVLHDKGNLIPYLKVDYLTEK